MTGDARREDPAAMRQERRRLLLLALVTLLGVLSLQLADATTGLLYLAPTVILLGFLVAGRYPGEEIVARCHVSVRPSARAPRTTFARRRAAMVLNPRGGALLALSLGGRAPPGLSRRDDWLAALQIP